MDLNEIRKKAREMMGSCRVCPVCNGVACAGQVPGMGGSGTGASFKSAFDSLAQVKLNMRLVHEVTDPTTETTVLGQKLALPVMTAPVAGVQMNFGVDDSLTEEEYCFNYLAGSRDAGTLGWFGDAVPDFFFEGGLKALNKLDGAAIPTLKPFEDEHLLPKLEKCAEAGAKLCAIDIDSAGLIIPRMMGRPALPKTTVHWRKICEHTDLKIIFKGVMTVDDAKKAVDCGAAGIVVSNHGGRIIDHLPGTAEVLPAIARAVGQNICVMADGGVRSGADVMKMIALGAECVLIGRPMVWAVVGGGREGAALYLNKIKDELFSAMIVTGCPDVTSIGPEVIYRPGDC